MEGVMIDKTAFSGGCYYRQTAFSGGCYYKQTAFSGGCYGRLQHEGKKYHPTRRMWSSTISQSTEEGMFFMTF